jgi:hypothetical protein
VGGGERPLPPVSRDVVGVTGVGTHVQKKGSWGPRAVGAPRMAIYYGHTVGAPVFWVTGDYFRLESLFVSGSV